MNREQFYKTLRSGTTDAFGTSLSQRQVEGMEALLDEGKGLPTFFMANILAQTHLETGGGMYPVKETVFRHSSNKNPTDAQVIGRLERAWAKGRLPWVSKPYWRDGGFGRGMIQLTHWYNYIKLSPYVGVDLRENPDAALEVVYSARIAVQGMVNGLFTGKSLSDYSEGGQYDHHSARAIVNGDTRINGQKIELLAYEFEKALSAGEWGVQENIEHALRGGFFSELIKAIIGIIRGRK